MAKSMFQRGDAIPAEWLNEVARAVLERVTVVGPGRAKRIGNSLMIELDRQLGGGGGESVLIPVTMFQDGGSQSTGSNAASWTYTVVNALDGLTVLGQNINPTVDPHKWNRITGQMGTATFGLAVLNPDVSPGFYITWCNEYILTSTC